MKVVVTGGGAAGMQAAATLRELGAEPVIVEREMRLGGKLTKWHKLFPTLTPAADVLRELEEKCAGIETMRGIVADSIDAAGVTLASGRRLDADAVIVATGFDIFRAAIKEEYGHGIYDNVRTTVEIEEMLAGDGVRMRDGSHPRRVAFVHCVGSRDEKSGQRHCSRVCCVTAVKQAMEVRETLPDCEVWNFYMDMRMFGPGYEEMYRRAQEEHNVHFVRGRVSEAAETIDGRIVIKAEDTLVGRPLRMTVDMLILAVGMVAGGSNRLFARNPAIALRSDGFIMPRDPFGGNVRSFVPGIFYAGTVTAPGNIGETINAGASAALEAVRHLRSRSVNDQ